MLPASALLATTASTRFWLVGSTKASTVPGAELFQAQELSSVVMRLVGETA